MINMCAQCTWPIFRGRNCRWAKLSLGENVLGETVLGETRLGETVLGETTGHPLKLVAIDKEEILFI